MPLIKVAELQKPQDTETPIDWDALCEVSPELVLIKSDAFRLLTPPKDRVFWERYESLKRRMASCVGWYARPGLPEFVHTSSAYQLAHQVIFGRQI